MIFKIAKPGEVLGLAAIIQGEPHDATAQILLPSQLNIIFREDLMRFLQQHGEVALRIAEQLSRNCRAAGDQLRSITLASSARERVAHLLLEWAEESHQNDDGTRTMTGMTHEDMAQLVGLSRETVTRILSEFRKGQITEFRGTQLMIRDKGALRAMDAQAA
jgi:CRP/FNR family transcriptional regulator